MLRQPHREPQRQSAEQIVGEHGDGFGDRQMSLGSCFSGLMFSKAVISSTRKAETNVYHEESES
jgi:hypothetical protein